MKHLKVFKTESAFDAEVMGIDKDWVTLTEDDSKAHFMQFKTSAAWNGGGQANYAVGKSEEYTSESPVELYETKNLTEIKFPSQANKLITLDSTNLEKVDLSDCLYGSYFITEVKNKVGPNVVVIEPPKPEPTPYQWSSNWTLGYKINSTTGNSEYGTAKQMISVEYLNINRFSSYVASGYQRGLYLFAYDKDKNYLGSLGSIDASYGLPYNSMLKENMIKKYPTIGYIRAYVQATNFNFNQSAQTQEQCYVDKNG